MGDHGARQLSPLFARRVIRWDKQTGAYQLNLEDGERTMLKELAPQFTELLDDPDHPALMRLFPPAYSNLIDVEHQDEYRRLMMEDLVARHREEFEMLESTADADALSEQQLLAWSRAINSIRLVLGTYLDITEDDDDRAPLSSEESVYRWLTFLLGEAIEAMADQT